MPAKLRKNDEIVVISGKHKGQVGKIISLDWTKSRAVVEKVNMVKKHNKPSQTNPEGGILEKEASIHISNIALKEKSKNGKATRVGFKKDEKGKAVRILKSTGKEQ